MGQLWTTFNMHRDKIKLLEVANVVVVDFFSKKSLTTKLENLTLLDISADWSRTVTLLGNVINF